jgi:hypothetical protein
MAVLRRNDTRDTHPAEVKLIRVGHLLWLDRRKALKSGDVEQVRALDEALETVWKAKREKRAELTVERAEKSATLRLKFGKVAA